jgi:hypothetical protein
MLRQTLEFIAGSKWEVGNEVEPDQKFVIDQKSYGVLVVVTRAAPPQGDIDIVPWIYDPVFARGA